MSGRLGGAVAVALLGLAGAPVDAKVEYMEVFQQAYSVKVGAALAGASCATCHAPAGPPRRNAFGDEVQKALDAAGTKALSVAVLQQAEAADSDGDGWSNLEEIAAGTLPGDAGSRPEPPAAPASEETRPAPPEPATPPRDSVKKPAPPKAAPTAKPAATSPPADPKNDAPAPTPPPPVTPIEKSAPPAPAAPETAPSQPDVQVATAPPVTALPATRPLAPPAPQPPAKKPLLDRLVPRHSFHPVIVHFPIALFLFGGFCELLGTWRRHVVLRTAGALNMTAASITSLMAIATGFLVTWRSGYPLQGTVLVHMLLAVAATAAMGATALVGWQFTKPSKERTSWVYWTLLMVSLVLVGVAGHFGGELVYGS